MHDGLTGELGQGVIILGVFPNPKALIFVGGGIAAQFHVKATKEDFTMSHIVSQETNPTKGNDFEKKTGKLP